MASGATAARETRGLRSGLRAVGAMLGVPVVVDDGTDWRLDGGELRVGLGWYAARGHGEAEALALAALQLWEGPRGERHAPDRARRRRSIERLRPQDGPLLAGIMRLQAVEELLVAMPGLREPLTAALRRTLPGDPSTLPRHLQWVSMLLVRGIDGWAGAADSGIDSAPSATLDPAVLGEWHALSALGGDIDALRRVLAPDPARTPLRRLERAVALLQPPYARLLVRDLAERGLSDAAGADAAVVPDAAGGDSLGCAERSAGSQSRTAGDDGDDGDDEGAEGDGNGGDAGAGGAGETDRDPAAEASDDVQAEIARLSRDSGADLSDEAARRGSGRQSAEGSDLFAAEQAGFVRTVLATPMPAAGGLIDSAFELAAEARAVGPGDPQGTGAAQRSAGGAVGATRLADYRRRVAELAPAIERMRQLWQRVIAERIVPRSAPSRRPLPAGDELAAEHLAGAVAQVRAGIRNPPAFRDRVPRPRRTQDVGSTDYVLLVDRSASMQGPAAEAAADAMLVLAEALAGVDRDIAHAQTRSGIDFSLDVRTALIAFDAEPEVLKPLSHGIADATRRAVHASARAARGSTDDGAALRAAAIELGILPGAVSASEDPRTSSDGLQRRRIVILVGDGGTNDPGSAAVELRRLRAAGAEVHGIGIGTDELIVRYAPNGHRVEDPRRVPDALEALLADGLA